MKAVIEVRIADEELEDVSAGGPEAGPHLSKILDEELIRFDAWMQKHLGGGMSRIEKAAIKTYLYQKIVGRVDHLDAQPFSALELITAKTG